MSGREGVGGGAQEEVGGGVSVLGGGGVGRNESNSTKMLGDYN